MMNIRALSEAALSSGASLLNKAAKTFSRQDEVDSATSIEKLERQMKIEKQIEIEDAKDRVDKEESLTTGNSTTPLQKAPLKIISLDEIAWHDTTDNCWCAIYDYVYDCTDFLKDHPGGEDILLEYAGRDATLAFIGAGHSKFAQKSLERYLIGELPPDERIFRVSGGVKVYGL